MKTVLLVRHAKSDWSNGLLSDFDRPLNSRGKNDAPLMANRLLDKEIKIDAFISSPAKRARKTAAAFASVYRKDKNEIISRPGLYEAARDTFYEVIKEVNDRDDCIALFAHNPGLTDFANLLTDTRIDNIPTCGIFAIEADSKSWKNFRDAPKKFLFFDFPKAGAD